ncbi:MAG TPA: phosphoribosylanthranilate isomerase [Anaerolineae bacterium]|nr:phosphoribosylanthranilate isomerase [Anaerolineae bacterium]
MVKVKICGLTQLDDALVAAAAGADMLGFILWEGSKRAISAEALRKITTQLRQLDHCPTLVGVFVNRSATEIAHTLDFCDLDLAQLHSNEPPSLIHDPNNRLHKRAYKALRPQNYVEAAADSAAFLPLSCHPDHPQLLVDAYHPTEYGGTGELSDWEIARRLVATVPQLLLAGGLNPHNVAAAIAQTGVWGVDVASGVEARAGIKDQAAVRAFIRAAKAAR